MVAHGVRQTPSRQTRPVLQSESNVQTVVSRQLGWQNASVSQNEPVSHDAEVQSGRQRASTQCSPVAHIALEEQSWVARQKRF